MLSVVESVNRIGGGAFSGADLERLGVFAKLIAISLRDGTGRYGERTRDFAGDLGLIRQGDSPR